MLFIIIMLVLIAQYTVSSFVLAQNHSIVLHMYASFVHLTDFMCIFLYVREKVQSEAVSSGTCMCCSFLYVDKRGEEGG